MGWAEETQAVGPEKLGRRGVRRRREGRPIRQSPLDPIRHAPLESSLQEIPAMPTNYKVRGCCCGIPFGCGVLVLGAGGMVALWKFALPGLATLLGIL